MATFDELENSNDRGQPVALYQFRIGSVYWRYTSADRDLSWGGHTWSATAISDKGTERGNADQDKFEVTLPSHLPIVALFRATAPSETIWVTAFRIHWPDPASAPVFFVGTVTDVARPKETARAVVRCKPITASFERGGLRLAYSRGCPHVLYDHDCRVDKELFKFEDTVDQVDGTTFRLPAFAGTLDHFKAGFAQWEREPGLPERRGIIAVTDGAPGALVEVIGTTDGIAVGTAMTIYQGCPHNPEGCQRFANDDNYGGFERLPGKSPFDGNPVF